MNEMMFGLISGLIVGTAMFYYGLIILKRTEIESNIFSWIGFNLIGFSILLNLILTNSGWNILAAAIVFLMDVWVLACLIKKKVKVEKNPWDNAAISLAVVSLFIFFFVKGNKEYEQSILLIPTLANVFASIPAMRSAIKNPKKDSPWMFMIFTAYSLSYFSVPEGQWGAQVVALAMIPVPMMIWLPLVVYRIKNKRPLRDW